jgi:hypothetical protein
LIDEPRLRDGLKRLLKQTEENIRERLTDEPTLEVVLKTRHEAAVEANRAAAAAYQAFRDDAITQAAVHWLLACVFVRFLEDNCLIGEAWIGGPGERLTEAQDRRSLFYRENPRANDADYLKTVFAKVASLPGVADLFDQKHNPLWSLGPTGAQALEILRFFQQKDESTGALLHDFTDDALGTRFLGDLYQNLSESARKRYALCQTPDFVVQFILDRTLTPALDVFGLEQTKLIDPTCGSGHFLLAAFHRLFAKWQEREPTGNPRVLAQKAISAVAGVDLNPFAVAIARFRLLVASLKTCKIARLRDAPDFHFELATGDSLLHGGLLGRERAVQRLLGHDPAECFYLSEDEQAIKSILGCQYHVVVGNPPYINVSDATLRETYRTRYGSCHGKYQLTVPFIERFFNLAQRPDGEKTRSAGIVGLIVSNAFMKRSFGRKLIEEYIPNWDLTHVIDTSGVYLPGHGTPTAILLGKHQQPVSETIRAVRGIRGETNVPDDPAHAPVWTAILAQVDSPSSESKYISVADPMRKSFQKYPWSIGGGGATELKEFLDEAADKVLDDLAEQNGITAVAGEGEVYVQLSEANIRRLGVEKWKPIVEGELIREWSLSTTYSSVWVYDDDFRLCPLSEIPMTGKFLWFFKSHLSKRRRFGVPMLSKGLTWYEWQELYPSKLRISSSIAFGEIATHNHFIFDRLGHVYDNTTRVIKLASTATDDHYFNLLGLLNSSVACFWLKQICFPKGGDHVGQEGARVTKVQWEERYVFDSTKVKRFPVPVSTPLELARAIQATAEARSALMPNTTCAVQLPTRILLENASTSAAAHLARMIALQEELDWQAYHFYGLLDEDISLPPDEIPPLALGERPFEILMARKMAARELETAWFVRHHSTPITELPAHWPEAYREVIEKRLEIIQSNRDIALIEQPEYKRRWNLPSWEELEKSALQNWLLDRMESETLWRDHELRTCSRLADHLRRDDDFMRVAELLAGSPDFDVTELVTKLASSQAVPFLPILRYKESGLRKRAQWEEVWELQRREDEGETVEIPVPSRYHAADFLDSQHWNLRGGLDVPKERFILYSHLQRDSDRTPLLGWAGWDHLAQAQALAHYYHHVKEEEGWPVERLKPVLAGLQDLIPWLKQWHNEVDATTGERMGDAFQTFLETECQELGFPMETLREWKPTQSNSRRARAGRSR